DGPMRRDFPQPLNAGIFIGRIRMRSAVEIFCIWPRALPRCRPCRASRGRKPIRRGRLTLTDPERCYTTAPLRLGGFLDLERRNLRHCELSVRELLSLRAIFWGHMNVPRTDGLAASAAVVQVVPQSVNTE